MLSYVLRMILGLTVLFGCLTVFTRWAQQTNRFSPKQTNLSIEDCLRVSPKATLQVVRVGASYLLISVTEQHVSVLKELTDAEAVNWKVDSLDTSLKPKASSHWAKVDQLQQWFKPQTGTVPPLSETKPTQKEG